MSREPDELGCEALAFFGRISASVSHELKNVLAVTQESAGLLEDLARLAEQGQPLTPERLVRCAVRIQDQVKRGDAIVRNLNAFAHSFDFPRKEVVLGEVLELMATLCVRLAAQKNVGIRVEAQGAPITLTTCPFLFENLLFRCLEAAIAAASSGEIVIAAQADAETARVTITCPAAPAADFPGEQARLLAAALSAQASCDAGGAAIVITMPRRPAP